MYCYIGLATQFLIYKLPIRRYLVGSLKAEQRFSHNNACNVFEFTVTLIAFLIYETIVACGGGSLSFPVKSNKHPGIDFNFVTQKAFFVMLLLNRRHSLAFVGEFLARVRERNWT